MKRQENNPHITNQQEQAMLLQTITLHNIRSYREQTVSFPEGSCLLSGDIGSGKSTILLAIEFALFGTSRPDLPGEALLRKGSTQGSVELSFMLGKQQVSLKRSLKKERDAVKQLPGELIIDNVRKELMPTELKSEVISLLGYPPEFAAKNKNYIFRYTLYTPQEEMKSILQENTELRLDTLRKIFNIDKYKIIRENLQSYLRSLREKILVLETKAEPLPELQRQHGILEGEKKTILEELHILQPRLADLHRRMEQQEKEMKEAEAGQQKFQELQNEYATAMARLKEKEEEKIQWKKKEESILAELHSLLLPPGTTVEAVEREKDTLEREKEQFLAHETTTKNRIAHLSLERADVDRQSAVIEQERALLAEQEKKGAELQNAGVGNDRLEAEMRSVEHTMQMTRATITERQARIASSNEVLETIRSVKRCPTCLQEVSEQHRQDVIIREQRSIEEGAVLLAQLFEQERMLKEEQKRLEEKAQHYREKEKELLQMQERMEHLRQRQEQSTQLQKKKQRAEEEQRMLERQLAVVQQEQYHSSFQKQIMRCQELLKMLLVRKQGEKQLHEIAVRQETVSRQITSLSTAIAASQQQLSMLHDRSGEIATASKELHKRREEEKMLLVRQAQLQAQQMSLEKQEATIAAEIEQCAQFKQTLTRTRELHFWLGEHFLPLTQTIEKQIMVNVHYLFTTLFQEWFSTLIDDQGISATLDDSFYPLITINGYEIPFTHLSGGERTSAALAYRLALHKVINDIIHEIKTRGLIILDEPTDGFSSEQLDKVREVLERLQLRQTIIVSHESKIESFVEHILRVQKEGDLSHVSTG